MDKNDVIKFYYENARKYNIQYKLNFIGAKRTLGYANLAEKIIAISKWHIKGSSDESVKNTILHEIAHALAYERDGATGHCAKWKSVCLEVGAKPEAKSSVAYNIEKPPSKYTLLCPNCGQTYDRHRMRKGSVFACNVCEQKPILEIIKNW